MTDLANVVVRMQADNSQMLKTLEQTTAKFQKFSHDTASAVKDLAVKFAAAFTVDKMAAFSIRAIEAAARLDELAASSGVSVEQLSGLSAAFAGSGVDVDGLGAAFKKLNISIADASGNATSKAGAAFRTLGISVKDASGNVKDAGTLMNEIADKFAQTADGANKTALAVAIFGRAGEKMIKTLDQGAESLARSAQQLKEWGLQLTGPEAAAAEELEGKVKSLSSALISKLGGQLAEQVLPVMKALIDAFTGTGAAASGVAVIVSGLADAFRMIGAAVIVASGELIAIGQAALGVGKAFYDLYTFKWGKVGGDLTEGFGKAFHTTAATITATQDLLDAGTERSLTEISTLEAASKRIKPPSGNLAATEGYDTAIKKLKDYSDTLAGQAASFGLGKVAMIDYSLQFGSLHEAVVAAGKDGEALAATIHRDAVALQTKMDTAEIQKVIDALEATVAAYGQSDLAAEKLKNTTGTLGETLDRTADKGVAARAKMDALAKQDIWQKDQTELQAIQRETDKLTGSLHDAAAAAFEFSHAALTKNLAATDDRAGQAQLATLKAQSLAQADFNQLVEDAAVVTENLRAIEADTALSVAKGQQTEIRAGVILDEARNDAVQKLTAIHDQQVKIAESGLGNPKEISDAKAFAVAITDIKKQTDQLTDSVRNNLESSFADNFTNLITGAQSFTKAVQNMMLSIQKMFLDAIAKNYAKKLFGDDGLFGGAAGGLSGLLKSLGGGGSSSTASSLVGAFSQNGGAGGSIGNIVGSFAGGGTIPQGRFGMVGENGPELAYSGAQALHIVPQASAGKTIQMTNNFSTPTSNGVISRPSQMQQAAAVARVMSQANRRNNG